MASQQCKQVRLVSGVSVVRGGGYLLLVLALREEARLDAVAGLKEGAALGELTRLVRQHAGRVARDQRRDRAVQLPYISTSQLLYSL